MSKALPPDKSAAGARPRPWREAAQIILDAAANLAAANQAQSKRRRAKPVAAARSERTGLKLVNFGAARFLDDRIAAASVAGARIGLPAYMSPERCRGQHADARSDLYALTCRFYELLTGELPFKSADVPTLQYEHCYAPFPDAASIVPGLPDGVRQVLARGTEKGPAERYQSAAQMVDDLTALLATSGGTGISVAAGPLCALIVPGETMPGSCKGRKIAYTLLAMVIFGAVIALFIFRDFLNPPLPPGPKNSVAHAPRHAPPSMPATTQIAAIADTTRPTRSPASTEKAIPLPEPRDDAAYLRGLGIIDKPMLERGVLLRSFDFTRPIPPKEWPAVAGLMNDAEYVLFHNKSGTDEAVSHVATLTKLQRLSLGGEPVTDKGCTFLTGHASLQRLDLANTAISGAAIPDIASIPNLTALDVRKTAVHGDCWTPLRHSRISSLWLAGNRIEDRDLADLAGHPSLSFIQLSDTQVTDSVIDTLASMPNFRQAEFSNTRIDDAGVAKLGGLQNLVTLEISACPIGENGLIPLANLKKLRRLVTRKLALSDQALESLAECSQLEGLDLGGCRFDASGLSALSRLSMLRSLRLGGAEIASSGNPAITRQILDDLKRKTPNLLIEGTPSEARAP